MPCRGQAARTRLLPDRLQRLAQLLPCAKFHFALCYALCVYSSHRGQRLIASLSQRRPDPQSVKKKSGRVASASLVASRG